MAVENSQCPSRDDKESRHRKEDPDQSDGQVLGVGRPERKEKVDEDGRECHARKSESRRHGGENAQGGTRESRRVVLSTLLQKLGIDRDE